MTITLSTWRLFNTILHAPAREKQQRRGAVIGRRGEVHRMQSWELVGVSYTQGECNFYHTICNGGKTGKISDLKLWSFQDSDKKEPSSEFTPINFNTYIFNCISNSKKSTEIFCSFQTVLKKLYGQIGIRNFCDVNKTENEILNLKMGTFKESRELKCAASVIWVGSGSIWSH